MNGSLKLREEEPKGQQHLSINTLYIFIYYTLYIYKLVLQGAIGTRRSGFCHERMNGHNAISVTIGQAWNCVFLKGRRVGLLVGWMVCPPKLHPKGA